MREVSRKATVCHVQDSIGLVDAAQLNLSQFFLIKKEGYWDAVTRNFILGERFNGESLTVSEYQVFKYLLLGNTAKTISRKVHKDAKTVEYHTNKILKKLGCKKKQHLIERAIESGLFYLSVIDESGGSD